MKKQLITLALTVTLMGSVFAANATTTTTAPEAISPAQTQVIEAMPALNNMDMQAAFSDAQSMQFAALTSDEMLATQGAWSWRRFFRAVVAVAIVTVCVVGSGPTLGGAGVACSVAL